jgi:UTP--glucose-1-phosphate uridylyltransferase
VLRSDVFRLTDGGVLESLSDAPLVTLDPRHFRAIADFEARFPYTPSLASATSFEVEGDWTFGADIVVVGDVRLSDEGAGRHVPDGARLG